MNRSAYNIFCLDFEIVHCFPLYKDSEDFILYLACGIKSS